jgi:phage tail-like protein
VTQASPSNVLGIQLTPMQIPEAVPFAGLMTTGPTGLAEEALNAQGILSATNLVLRPGEPSEMIVQVKNLSAIPLWLNIQVEGDFPITWCRIGMEGHQVAPGQQMEAVLYFQTPASYFEDQQALIPGHRQNLRLDFRAQVYFSYGETSMDLDQVETADFSLHVRDHSLYLNFLPVIFREVDFIGRFLKIFEQAFEPAVQTMDAMWANLDPLTAPKAMLPFLAYWVAWPLNKSWGLAQQRRLIKRALEMYRWRGTRKGLRLFLHLYTGLPLDDDIPQEAEKHISISDQFGRGFVLGSERLGQGTVLGGGRPFHFVVRLQALQPLVPDKPPPISERLVRMIIDQEKPAFCTYELVISYPSAQRQAPPPNAAPQAQAAPVPKPIALPQAQSAPPSATAQAASAPPQNPAKAAPEPPKSSSKDSPPANPPQ